MVCSSSQCQPLSLSQAIPDRQGPILGSAGWQMYSDAPVSLSDVGIMPSAHWCAHFLWDLISELNLTSKNDSES